MSQDTDKNVVYFARTDFRNTNRLFGIKRTDRRQHTYVIGKTGTGKSAMLNNMIIQDIANGEGLCVVDPHGELVEGLLQKIPENRIKDVIYFNPADPDFHIGFNILELPDPKYKHLVASGLMGIFTKIWSNVWSARMEYILNNAILALLDTPNSTLLGIPRLLTDKDYRQKVVSNLTDPVVKAFWVHEFEAWRDQFRNEAIAPIQNKVGQFLSTAMIRNIVGQSKSTIDVFEIMNSGKILLVNVSKGRIGEDNAALLGAMLITKIQLAAMERVRVPEDERVDFYLYVDEFQNFATDSFAGILSEARKYRLNLILSHQYIGQLVTEQSTKVRDAVFGNVGTMIVFRVGAADAEYFESEFEPEFVIQDIVNLPNYCIYLKLMVDGVTCRPFSAATIPPLKVQASSLAEMEIVNSSRKRYMRSRTTVEEEINRWSGIMATEASGDGGGGELMPGKFKAICSSCGKETTLPFDPDPRRPVYCKECLKKIESGEMRPVRLPRGGSSGGALSGRSQDRRLANNDELASLGIEFQARPGETFPEERPRERERVVPMRVPVSAPRGEAPREQVHREAPRPPVSPAPRFRDVPEHYSPRPPALHPPHLPHPPRGAPQRVEVPQRSVLKKLEEREVAGAPRPPQPSISLSELRPEAKEAKRKISSQEIDIEGLRRAIHESLEKAAEAKSAPVDINSDDEEGGETDEGKRRR